MITAALSAIPAATQAGLGIYQAIKGFDLANAERPQYEIPQEILDNLTDAEIQALRGLPAQQKREFIDNVQRSQQASINALGDRKAGLSGVTGINQQSMDAYRNLLTADANQRQVNERSLMDVRSNVADYRDKEFNTNQMQPYLEQMQAAEAMKGAGFQNVMGGVSAGSQMGIDVIKFDKYMKMLEGFGGNNQSAIPSGTDLSRESMEVGSDDSGIKPLK
jgi:hypothetical protein